MVFPPVGFNFAHYQNPKIEKKAPPTSLELLVDKFKEESFFKWEGSYNVLVSSAKELLQDPNSDKKLDAFNAAFTARCTKLEIKPHHESTETVATLLKQALADGGKDGVTDLSKAQQDILVKIANIAKKSFVENVDITHKGDSKVLMMIHNVSTLEESIKKTAKDLATFFMGNEAGAAALAAEIKGDLFKCFEKSLTKELEVGAQSVQEREEAEKAKLADLEQKYRDFRSSEWTKIVNEHSLSFNLMQTKINDSNKSLKETVLRLNIGLSGLQETLNTLMKAGTQKGIDCSSQQELVKLLTNLTQKLVRKRSVESMKGVEDQLPALIEFLNKGDGRFSSGSVTKNLPQEKQAVEKAIEKLRASLKEFGDAKQVLATSKSDLEQLNTKFTNIKDANKKLELELNEQTTLLMDQVRLNEYTAALKAHEAASAQLRFYNSPIPAPKVPETTTGGVVAIVKREAAAHRATAQAIYDYLKPTPTVEEKPSHPSWLNWVTCGLVG